MPRKSQRPVEPGQFWEFYSTDLLPAMTFLILNDNRCVPVVQKRDKIVIVWWLEQDVPEVSKRKLVPVSEILPEKCSWLHVNSSDELKITFSEVNILTICVSLMALATEAGPSAAEVVLNEVLTVLE